MYDTKDERTQSMIAGIVCYSIIGTLIGVIFSLLFINFDKSWKKIISYLIGIGGTGGIIVFLNDFFEIDSQQMKFLTITSLYLMFLISFCVMMAIMCKLIKDKDDADILRIRDILLGQKSYIDKYYRERANEINKKLNIDKLMAREKEISEKEYRLNEKTCRLEREEEKINKLGKKHLKMQLPEKAKITLTRDHIDVMPSYFKDIINCVIEIKENEKNYLAHQENDITSFKGYLFSIAVSISSYVFNGNSTEIRIHFRYYDKNENGYTKLIAIIGKNIVDDDMTFIPYDKDNMILKSYDCKRALIKSINNTHDFLSNNYRVWKDYLTYTFHNIDIEGKPLLSFGISVKNEKRYEKTFHFLNYLKFEDYLQEVIINANRNKKIEDILYGGK